MVLLLPEVSSCLLVVWLQVAEFGGAATECVNHSSSLMSQQMALAGLTDPGTRLRSSSLSILCLLLDRQSKPAAGRTVYQVQNILIVS